MVSSSVISSTRARAPAFIKQRGDETRDLLQLGMEDLQSEGNMCGGVELAHTQLEAL